MGARVLRALSVGLTALSTNIFFMDMYADASDVDVGILVFSTEINNDISARVHSIFFNNVQKFVKTNSV